MTTKTKKPKFPDRVELGVGYPWNQRSNVLSMSSKSIGGPDKSIRIPAILKRDDIPQYRLVLEKVKE